jgi:hypothetical protein
MRLAYFAPFASDKENLFNNFGSSFLRQVETFLPQPRRVFWFTRWTRKCSSIRLSSSSKLRRLQSGTNSLGSVGPFCQLAVSSSTSMKSIPWELLILVRYLFKPSSTLTLRTVEPLVSSYWIIVIHIQELFINWVHKNIHESKKQRENTDVSWVTSDTTYHKITLTFHLTVWVKYEGDWDCLFVCSQSQS